MNYTYGDDTWGDLLTAYDGVAISYLGLYYLQSRYYDPELCRFHNADALISTGQGELGNNMFAYCNNNPVNYTDYSGQLCQYACMDDNSVFCDISMYGGSGGYGGTAYYPSGGSKSYINKLIATETAFITNSDPVKAYAYLKSGGIAFYNGAPVFVTDLPAGMGVSVGIIILDNTSMNYSNMSSFGDLLNHEYGHSVHLGQIGITTYLSMVAIPSLIGAGLTYVIPFVCENYESQPWERIAEHLGNVEGEYYPGSNTVGSIYWLITLLCSAAT